MPSPTAMLRAGAGEPVLLLHPFSLSHHVWRAVAEDLADSCEVLAPTMPGHWGGPTIRAREVSFDAMVDGVERILDDAGWQSCHVVGNSLGGWVGLELAKRGRARTVTAIAPAGGWRRRSWDELVLGTKFLVLYPFLLLGLLLSRLQPLLRPVVKLLLRTVSADVAKVAAIDVEHTVLASTRCRGYLPMIWSGIRGHGGIVGLDEVRCPVRLVFTDSDWYVPHPRYSKMFVDGIAHAETIVLPGVGHVPMLEAPELIATIIREHVEKHPATHEAPERTRRDPTRRRV